MAAFGRLEQGKYLAAQLTLQYLAVLTQAEPAVSQLTLSLVSLQTQRLERTVHIEMAEIRAQLGKGAFVLRAIADDKVALLFTAYTPQRPQQAALYCALIDLADEQASRAVVFELLLVDSSERDVLISWSSAATDAQNSVMLISSATDEGLKCTVLTNVSVDFASKTAHTAAVTHLHGFQAHQGCSLHGGYIALLNKDEHLLLLIDNMHLQEGRYFVPLAELNFTLVHDMACSFEQNTIHVVGQAGLQSQVATLLTSDIANSYKRVHSVTLLRVPCQLAVSARSPYSDFSGVLLMGADSRSFAAVQVSKTMARLTYTLTGKTDSDLYKVDHVCQSLNQTQSCSNLIWLEEFETEPEWRLRKDNPKAEVRYGWLDIDDLAELRSPYVGLVSGQASVHQVRERVVQLESDLALQQNTTLADFTVESGQLFSAALQRDSDGVMLTVARGEARYSQVFAGTRSSSLRTLTKGNTTVFCALLATRGRSDRLWLGQLSDGAHPDKLVALEVGLQLTGYSKLAIAAGHSRALYYAAVNVQAGSVYEVGSVLLTSDSASLSDSTRRRVSGQVEQLVVSDMSADGTVHLLYRVKDSMQLACTIMQSQARAACCPPRRSPSAASISCPRASRCLTRRQPAPTSAKRCSAATWRPRALEASS